jgi:hypothetical protein
MKKKMVIISAMVILMAVNNTKVFAQSITDDLLLLLPSLGNGLQSNYYAPNSYYYNTPGYVYQNPADQQKLLELERERQRKIAEIDKKYREKQAEYYRKNQITRLNPDYITKGNVRGVINHPVWGAQGPPGFRNPRNPHYQGPYMNKRAIEVRKNIIKDNQKVLREDQKKIRDYYKTQRKYYR